MIWDNERRSKAERMEAGNGFTDGKVIDPGHIVEFLESVARPRDRVVMEGCNQKQAVFLAKALKQVDPTKIYDLNIIMPSVSRSEHLDLFEKASQQS